MSEKLAAVVGGVQLDYGNSNVEFSGTVQWSALGKARFVRTRGGETKFQQKHDCFDEIQVRLPKVVGKKGEMKGSGRNGEAIVSLNLRLTIGNIYGPKSSCYHLNNASAIKHRVLCFQPFLLSSSNSHKRSLKTAKKDPKFRPIIMSSCPTKPNVIRMESYHLPPTSLSLPIILPSAARFLIFATSFSLALFLVFSNLSTPI